MKKKSYKKFLRSIWNFLTFFLLTAILVTCCMSLFLSIFSSKMGIILTKENISIAAKLTFGNVVLLTTIITAIDSIRRKLTVKRPVDRIIQAANKIMQGDFSVRIKPIKNFLTDDTFNEIIVCFNKMAEELSGIETLRTDFVANVSHELKTPLAVIQNYATLFSQPDLSENKRREYAKATIDTTRRLTDLISNILRLNKLENQQIFMQFKPYDLGEQLCECLLGFEDLWVKKELKIQTDIADSIIVESDREMMNLVWNNLFSNAIKFTENKGTIFISLHSENDAAIVKVQDTGCGISKEVGKHIFDKFYQGDTSHSSLGNGLGLALVKRIVDITGCEISITSEVGKGSTFTIKMQRFAYEKNKTNSF
jgi:signal transduction histidine kinase